MHYKAVELTEYLWWKGHKSCISIASMNLQIQSASLFDQFAHLTIKLKAIWITAWVTVEQYKPPFYWWESRWNAKQLC